MIMYNIQDVYKAQENCQIRMWGEREKELINALLDIRDSSSSGSYDMATVDECLGKLGYQPWLPGRGPNKC